MPMKFGTAIRLVERELLLLREDIVAGRTERWQRVLNAMAHHHAYRFENVLLIEVQQPGSTVVRSRSAWNLVARKVQERTPPIYVIDGAADKTRRLAFGEHWLDRHYVPPPMVEVFDVRDTLGQLPDRPEAHPSSPRGSVRELLDWTERVAARRGIDIIYDELNGSGGHSLGGVVVAERRLDCSERFLNVLSLLAEELVRACRSFASGVGNVPESFTAGCITYIVTSAVGFEPVPVPPPPPSSRDDLGVVALTALLARVHTVSSIILDGLQAELAEDLPV
jgi:hypothetical protein